MTRQRYPETFKIEAVKQITERGWPVADVARALGVSSHSLYAWLRQYGKPADQQLEESALQAEIRRLKAELRQVTEERNIPKGGRRVLCQRVKERYAFITSRLDRYSVVTLCQTLGVHRSGFYAWLKQPVSPRQQEDERLIGLVKQSWLESGAVYGYRKIHRDLRDAGEGCGMHRVAKLMTREGLRSQTGYQRRKGHYGGKSTQAAPNTLARQFKVPAPNISWVTDITYIRTQEGWLYLAVVLDLFSRQIVGWAMKSRMTADLAVDALLMAVWRRKPKQPVLVHSDQGSQFTGGEWQDFLKTHNLSCSMSRRGNCHDNAVAESFFQLLKRERIKRRIYATRDEARSDVFDYIEMFYNPIRRHGSNDGLSPVEFERQFICQQQSV
ncbi:MULTISPECIES: IS3 family transposase [Aeromonas]|uniref:IS3 family transposase n=1 Tax=Aeromonas TaxID=642 RepID=UPI0013274B99|nr:MULTISPECIES: IS3 family transposase [Aeromonas]MXQ71674.1 IS3 family transposase [Aeromonas caviae]UCM58408.1 IS3 family transposase [Aeromonas hydrophila]HAT2497352.1 IS3 family transposase [Aeromonas hydrophila]HAT2512192.1 IS3 family transposase [Aeromonas hydrophila]HAT2532683.1 IS3 family transposase [Aeromonas hydrophila]